MKLVKYFLFKTINFIKYYFLAIAVVLFVSLCVFASYCEEMGESIFFVFDCCNLTDVEYTAVLQDKPGGNAKVDIVEYLTFDIHTISKDYPIKELWRELPEDTVDGLRTSYNVKSVTQILDDGTQVPYSQASHMYWEDYDYNYTSTRYWYHSKGTGRYPDNDESLLIYIPWTHKGKLKFKIEYSMNYAALKYNDCSELYLSMYSGPTIRKLKSYRADILIPNDIMPSTYNVYTMGTSKKIPYTKSLSTNPGYTTFTIDLKKSDLKFHKNDEYIEFCLLAFGEDKHIFTKYAPRNDYTYDDALAECIEEDEYYANLSGRSNLYKICLLAVSILLSGLVVSSAERKYKKARNEYTFYEPYEDYQDFSSIPSKADPLFVSQLVFMKKPFDKIMEKGDEYSAVLLSLIRKGYVTLIKRNSYSDWSEENTIVQLTQTDTIYSMPNGSTPTFKVIDSFTKMELEPLCTSERLYLELLERHIKTDFTNSLPLTDLGYCIANDYEYTQAFVEDMKQKPMMENGVIGKYFQQVDYNVLRNKFLISAKFNLFLSLFFIVVVNFISSFTILHLGFGAYTLLGLAFLWKYYYLTIKSNDVVLFTQFGVNEQAKWVGLFNYLNNDAEIKDADFSDLRLWENYLIYATAFGLSKKILKTIQLNSLRININNSRLLYSRSHIHSHYHHRINRSFGSNIHHFSTGGSYGGGRRRWRRWRRSLKNNKNRIIIEKEIVYTISFLFNYIL